MLRHIKKLFVLVALTVVGLGAASLVEAHQPVRPQIYLRDYGFQVTYVFPGTTAHRHGLEPGDIIVRVNGHRLRNSSDLRYYLSQAGHSATLQVIDVRSGYTRNIRVYPHFGRIGVDGYLVALPGPDPYPPYPPYPPYSPRPPFGPLAPGSVPSS